VPSATYDDTQATAGDPLGDSRHRITTSEITSDHHQHDPGTGRHGPRAPQPGRTLGG